MKLQTVLIAGVTIAGGLLLGADAEAKTMLVKELGCKPANEINYKSGEKACRSGNFRGQTLQECKWKTYKHNGKRKKRWEPHYTYF